jgi:hypothetical protein
VSKFVGKFRKNKEYNDDYKFTNSKHRNEHAEIKKLLTQHEEDNLLEEEVMLEPMDEGWDG